MSKKMIEIPEDVARGWLEDCKASDLPLAEAIKKALPPPREERLGLPWVLTQCASGVMTELELVPLDCTNESQARLIAKAPEMAAMLERLCQEVLGPEGFNARLGETEYLLHKAGWLDE